MDGKLSFVELQRQAQEMAQAEAQAQAEREEAEQASQVESETAQRQLEHDQQAAELETAIDILRQSEVELAAFRESVTALAAKTDELRQSHASLSADNDQLLAVVAEVDAFLRSNEGVFALKSIAEKIGVSAEQLTIDEAKEHVDEVKSLRALEASLASVAQDVSAAEAEEQKLHGQIQALTGGDTSPTDLTQAREQAFQLIEQQLNQIRQELTELELQTPQGKDKAEVALIQSIVEAQDTSAPQSEADLKDRAIRPMRLPGDLLRTKDIVGEERLAQLVRTAATGRVDKDIEKYKHAQGLDAWERQLQFLRDYPHKMHAVEISPVAGTVDVLAAYLQTAPGLELFRSMEQAVFDKEVYEKTGAFQAEQLAEKFVSRMDGLAANFLFGKNGADASLRGELVDASRVATDAHDREQYTKLIDPDKYQANLQAYAAFISSISRAVEQPGQLQLMIAMVNTWGKSGPNSPHTQDDLPAKSYLSADSIERLVGLAGEEIDVTDRAKVALEMQQKVIELMPVLQDMRYQPEVENISNKGERRAAEQQLKQLAETAIRLKNIAEKRVDLDLANIEIQQLEQGETGTLAGEYEKYNRESQTVEEALPTIVKAQAALALYASQPVRFLSEGRFLYDSSSKRTEINQLADELKKARTAFAELGDRPDWKQDLRGTLRKAYDTQKSGLEAQTLALKTQMLSLGTRLNVNEPDGVKDVPATDREAHDPKKPELEAEFIALEELMSSLKTQANTQESLVNQHLFELSKIAKSFTDGVKGRPRRSAKEAPVTSVGEVVGQVEQWKNIIAETQITQKHVEAHETLQAHEKRKKKLDEEFLKISK